MFGIRYLAISRNHHGRRGASLLEIAACIAAVAVGVWLGARYLDLNLHAAAYTALTEAEVMDQLPEDWRLDPPEGMELPTAEEEAEALNAELEALRLDVTSLTKAEADIAAAAAEDEATVDLPPEVLKRRQHTLAFWSQLASIREEVVRLQATADRALNQDNMFRVLEIRRRAYQYGAKAVKAAMNDNVDPQALQFAHQLEGWYQHGADLYGEAMTVWQTQHGPSGGLSTDQLLEQVQQQHHNESLLIQQKSDRLREVLLRRYQVAFPSIDGAPNSQD
ncbi:hypothetical protein NG895_08050 [Aeoliella sp. ICT_H6.2]|uniref:Uncharacterized protein n=1 Tax=Aeoliella straminimaris TaxID=2954799 RepID=A0A9X2JGR7_9BACT|nr:hypothetical protein [Aeoliella straminimaris]MCO6043858.1 hypothetical protein [Aeoliella straminimaris]